MVSTCIRSKNASIEEQRRYRDSPELVLRHVSSAHCSTALLGTARDWHDGSQMTWFPSERDRNR